MSELQIINLQFLSFKSSHNMHVPPRVTNTKFEVQVTSNVRSADIDNLRLSEFQIYPYVNRPGS